MDKTSWIVFAGGGTGGHLFPALAVVESLCARNTPVDVAFFCTDRQVDRDILGQAGVTAIPQAVQPAPTKPWHWPAFLVRWQSSVSACVRAFRERRPVAVVGAGGYASGPPVHAALKLGIPTFLLNPDAVPGKANRHLARRKHLRGIFAQWEVTRHHLPAHAPVVVSGCPVRAAFRSAQSADVATIRRSFGLDPDRGTLLVTGASQGARTINEAFARLAELIRSTGWQVLHLSGPADREVVAQAYARAGTPAVVLAFTERMSEAMAACDLIVSRAGASTLAEIQAARKPSILLPYPYHKDRHQWHNAEVLVEAGAAVLVEDARQPEVNVRSLAPILEQLMNDEPRRRAMAVAAGGLDRLDAAESIAGELCRAAKIAFPGACELSEPPAPNSLSRKIA